LLLTIEAVKIFAVKLPEVISRMKIPDDKLKVISKHINSLLK